MLLRCSQTAWVLLCMLMVVSCAQPAPSTAFTTPETGKTPVPTATPTVAPTPISTATSAIQSTVTPVAETGAPGEVVLTEAEYRNEALGIVWHRPNDDWHFIDYLGLKGLDEKFLAFVTLVPQSPKVVPQGISLSAVRIPGSRVNAINQLIETDPEIALQQLFAEIGYDVIGADVHMVEPTEVAGVSGLFVTVGDRSGKPAFVWIIVRGQSAIFISAGGFDDIETVEAIIAGLEFVGAQTTGE